jgi:hypothetical protein
MNAVTLGSAADLKFLHGLLRVRPRNFKSISGTAESYFASALSIPKFA